MDTETLHSNYQQLITYTSLTDFGPPADGQWNAQQVIAHLTTNDELLLATTSAVMAGLPASYDNASAIDSAQLAAFADECGGLAMLLERLRESSRRVVHVVGQLDDETSSTMVPVRIVDGDEVRVDQPLPIAALFQAQANIHLPSHLQQLKDLEK